MTRPLITAMLVGACAGAPPVGAPADDIVIVATPGQTVRVDVRHNDQGPGEAVVDQTTLGVTVADDGWLLLTSPTEPGTSTFRYHLEADGVRSESATVTLYVDSYFDDVVARLEAGAEGARILDAFDEDYAAPWSPNLVLAVDRGDAPLLRRTWGRLDETTPVAMASASKLLAATLVLHAVDEGRVGLDDPFTAHLPTFTDPGYDGDGPQRGAITLRQAFSMSAGLYSGHRYHTMRTLDHDASVEAIRHSDVDLGNGFTTGPVPVAFEPGTHVGYDGKGMQVAGRAVLAARGDDLDWLDYARTALFDPCGMGDSSWDAFFPNNPAIAGGAVTSARDYLRALRMLTGDGTCGEARILDPGSAERLFEFHLTPDGVEPHRAPIWGSPWPNCGEVPYVAATPLVDCSAWLDGTPTDGSWYEHGLDTPRYTLGAWAIEVVDGEVETIVSPGAWGTAPWIDRGRGLHGILLTDIGYPEDDSGGRAIWPAELQLLQLLRQAWDRGSGQIAPVRLVED